MKPLDIEPIQNPSPTKKIASIEDLWRVFTRMRGDLAPNTLLNYRYYGNRFCDFISKDERPLAPATMIDWVKYLQDLGIGSNKINHCNSIIKNFMKFLKTMGYVQEDLASCIPRLKGTPPSDSKIFTEEEYQKIKAYCTGRSWCQPHLWLIILAYRTGMSLVDCCHLRWCHVTLDDNGPSFITIHRIKTVNRVGFSSKCHIPIIPGSDVHQWLLFLRDNTERYKRHDGIDDYVHQDAPGLYACRFATIGNDFKNIFVRCGIGKEKTFKHFRNSFCSNLINSGTQIALICKMTGHSNVTTLLRYLKPDSRALQDGLAKAFQMAETQYGTGKGNDGLTFERPQ